MLYQEWGSNNHDKERLESDDRAKRVDTHRDKGSHRLCYVGRILFDLPSLDRYTIVSRLNHLHRSYGSSSFSRSLLPSSLRAARSFMLYGVHLAKLRVVTHTTVQMPRMEYVGPTDRDINYQPERLRGEGSIDIVIESVHVPVGR